MNSSSMNIEKSLEAICEALVFVEVSDPKGLADIHTQFEGLRAYLGDAGHTELSKATRFCEEIVEKLILAEAEDPAAAMGLLNKTVAALQAVIRDGRELAGADFPDEIGLFGHKAAPGTSKTPPVRLSVVADEAILGDFLSRQAGVLEELESLILGLETDDGETSVGAIRRIIHTLKGESGLLGLADVERLCHALEDAMQKNAPRNMVDGLLKTKDWLEKVFNYYSGKGPAPEAASAVIASLSGASEESKVKEAPPTVQEKPEEKSQEESPDAEITIEADPDLLAEFVNEAMEHLETADVHLLTLETSPSSEEALNAVFRAFHTIKGVAGFLGLDEIGTLSHQAENLLDMARKGDLELSGAAIDVTFESVDSLKVLVAKCRDFLETGMSPRRDRNLSKLIARIKMVAAGQIPPESAAVVEETEQKRLGEILVNRGVISESALNDALQEQIARPSAKLGDILIESGIVSPEDIAEALQKQKEPPARKKLGEILVESNVTSSKRVAKALIEQEKDPSKPKLGEVLVRMEAVSEEELEEALEVQSQDPKPPRLGEILVKEGKAKPQDIVDALRKQKTFTGQKAVVVRETVKVDAIRLDSLVNNIGELVIAESMVSQSLELRHNASQQMIRQLSLLDKITRELQEIGMSLRMIPLRSTFQKMARLVRDLSRKSGKEVDFVMEGEDTELDKTVVDKIGDPLVHMVRNAVDHGIEATPETRRLAGKPTAGRVELRAFHKGGSIYIEVEDDGRGINRDVVVAKAKERGLVGDGDHLSDRDVYNLLFAPGFSTAEKVTDVSGRGVGMDVVKRNIDSLRGQVEIKSEVGAGSVFSIRLPLTLAIIDGMVVKVGNERYILPTLSILMSIRPEAKDLTQVLNKGEMFQNQGRLIPLFRLGKLFKVEGAVEDPTLGSVVVLEDERKQVGLLVDELLGQQQTVIKNLGEMLHGTPGISGGAIMPDGTVGLILDVGGIVRLAHKKNGSTQ